MQFVLRAAPMPGDTAVIGFQGRIENADRTQTSNVPSQTRSSQRFAEGLAPEPPTPSLADRLRAILQVPLESLLPGPNTTIEWPAELFSYQLEGVRALLERDRVLLADDMGLGKTIQAIAAVRILCLQRQIRCCLLVVPASLVDQWRREIYRWAPELRLIVIRGQPKDRAWQWKADAHVTIVSYDTLRTDFTDNPDSPPRRRTWDVVILDEAQRIKNRDSEISRECKMLPRQRSWAMTGTPLENTLDDLASIMEFVDHTPGSSPPRFFPGPELLERHRELQLRRRKQDVLTELPAKQVVHLSIPLLPHQQQTYLRAEQEGVLQLRELGPEMRIEHVLELIMRLKQICNFCPRTGESAKVEDIRNRLEVLSAEGHRALIFSQFVDEPFGVNAAAKALAEFAPLTYVGAMSGAERDRIISEFKSHPQRKALILSLKAGGVGLNLQEASYVFHLDRWWNPAVERQAEDRSHRLGQLFSVTVFKYACAETIEERIHEILVAKQRLFDEIVDDVSLDLGVQLTQDEMFGLFGLTPSAPAPVRQRPSGMDLEERCERILVHAGWTVRRTPRSRDGGIDLIASRIDEVGVEHKLFVQCKDHARPIGVEVVRELLGVLPPGDVVRAVIAAPPGLTSDGARLAADRGVIVWDQTQLADLEART